MIYHLYKWVDILNIEPRSTAKPTLTEPTPIYESDEMIFFECVNRTNLHKLLYYLRIQFYYHQINTVLPPPYYIPYLPQGR